MMKRLRGFVSFDYDLRQDLSNTLTSNQKAEIRRYYNAIADASSAKHVKYRPKSKANIERARANTGQNLKKLTAFAIPSPTGGGKVKWRDREETVIRKGKTGKTYKRVRKYSEAVIEKEGGMVRSIYLDQKALAKNPREYLKSVMKPKGRYIVAGNNDWAGGGDFEATIRLIEEAMLKYGWGGPDEDEDFKKVRKQRRIKKEGRGQFAITLVEVETGNQKSFLQYKAARRKAQDDYHASKRKDASKAKRAAKRTRGARPR